MSKFWHIQYDGHDFNISIKNFYDGDEIIGWYLDGTQNLQIIKRDSVYGYIVDNKIASAMNDPAKRSALLNMKNPEKVDIAN
jgi:hypothetical protein